MLNKKGLTLIEIIVSIALLGIISVALLTSFSSHFTFLANTKAITRDVFQAQNEIEEKIERVRADLKGESSPSVTPSPYTLFDTDPIHGDTYQRTVQGYVLEGAIGSNRKLLTIVADTRMPHFPVPKAVSAELVLRLGGATLSSNFDYVVKSGLSMRATSTITDTDNVFLVNRHEWFVSRPGFNIPMVNWNLVDKDYDLGRLYPLFPNDYHPIPIKMGTDMLSQNDLTTLVNQYAGRNIIYTITPYAVSGKKGATIFSNPIFLTGPTVTDGLLLHLDASLISKEDTTSVDAIGDTLLVKQWKNIVENNNHASQSSESLKPELLEVQYQEDVYVWGKSLKQNASGTSMTISSFSPSSLSSFSLILVAKSNTVNPPGTNIISTTGTMPWSFGWGSDDNLVFQSGGSDPAVLEDGKGLDGDWRIFTCIASGGDLTIRMDGVEEATGSYTSPSSSRSFTTPTINWNDMEIAEILIYNRNIASNTDVNTIETFLINKYNPNPADISVSIVVLNSIPTITVNKGQPYLMPTTVRALMSNGTTQNVAVTWSAPIDTSIHGTQTSIGTAVMDNTKTITLTVQVLAIDRILDLVPITVEKGQLYSLPVTLPALLTNGTTRDVEVVWSGNVYTLDLGVHTLVGTAVIDNTKTVELEVNVIPVAVTEVVISETNLTLIKNHTITLSATVIPDNAANQSVQWSSSDPAIASVNNGIVTAHLPGITTITVTTLDGGHSSMCTVTVIPVPVMGVTLNKSSINQKTGQSETLIATVSPVDAANKSVIWTSSNNGIATVNSSGVVTAIGPGTAIITVNTVDGGFSASCTINVTQPVTGVSLNQSSISIGTLETFTLIHTVSPSNASNKNVTWSTNNASVATVLNGVVTGVSVGNATITATTVDGNFTGQCVVQVTQTYAVVAMRWQRGQYSNEPGWEVIDTSNNSVVYCVPTGHYQQNNTPTVNNFTIDLSLKRGQTYQIRGFDHWGDGWNGGILTFTQNGGTIFTTTGPPNAGNSPSPNVCNGTPTPVTAAGAAVLGTFTVQ